MRGGREAQLTPSGGQAQAREQTDAKRGNRFDWPIPEGVSKFAPRPQDGWIVDHLLSDKQRHIYRALNGLADQDKQPRDGRRVVRASYRRIQQYCHAASVRIHISTIRRNISLMVDKELIAPWNASSARELKPSSGESVIGRRVGEGNRDSTWYMIRPYAEVLDRLKRKPGVGHVRSTEAFHFGVYGRAHRLMTQAEIDTWNVHEFSAWLAGRNEKKASSGPELVSQPVKRPAQEPTSEPKPPPEPEIDLEPLRDAIALNCKDPLVDDRILMEVWKIAAHTAQEKGESMTVETLCAVLRHWRTVQKGRWADNPGGVATGIAGRVRAWLNKAENINRTNAQQHRDRDVNEVCRLILAADSGDEITRDFLRSVSPDMIAEAKERLRTGQCGRWE